MDKEKKSAFNPNTAEELIFLLVGLLLLSVIMGQLAYFLGLLDASGILGWWQALVEFLIWFWPVWKTVVIFLALACVAWVIYSYIKLQGVISEEEKVYGRTQDDAFEEEGSGVAEKENKKWVKVLEHANSSNPTDWRLAIIEADVMLEEVLRKAGYVGDGVGEMLKSVDKSDMLTLNFAWDAHKVRNRIAHDGSGFQLDERETRRVISLFESVFREFQII